MSCTISCTSHIQLVTCVTVLNTLLRGSLPTLQAGTTACRCHIVACCFDICSSQVPYVATFYTLQRGTRHTKTYTFTAAEGESSTACMKGHTLSSMLYMVYYSKSGADVILVCVTGTGLWIAALLTLLGMPSCRN